MPYTPELKELIKKVEATREARVARKMAGDEIPFLDLDQRKERLKFHPDFIEEGRRPLKVGPSKGYAIAHELADLIEATSRVNPDRESGRTPVRDRRARHRWRRRRNLGGDPGGAQRREGAAGDQIAPR
jgi:hypothetical protein